MQPGDAAEGCQGVGKADPGAFSPVGAVHSCKLWLIFGVIFYLELVKSVWVTPSSVAAPFSLPLQ